MQISYFIITDIDENEKSEGNNRWFFTFKINYPIVIAPLNLAMTLKTNHIAPPDLTMTPNANLIL